MFPFDNPIIEFVHYVMMLISMDEQGESYLLVIIINIKLNSNQDNNIVYLKPLTRLLLLSNFVNILSILY